MIYLRRDDLQQELNSCFLEACGQELKALGVKVLKDVQEELRSFIKDHSAQHAPLPGLLGTQTLGQHGPSNTPLSPSTHISTLASLSSVDDSARRLPFRPKPLHNLQTDHNYKAHTPKSPMSPKSAQAFGEGGFNKGDLTQAGTTPLRDVGNGQIDIPNHVVQGWVEAEVPKPPAELAEDDSDPPTPRPPSNVKNESDEDSVTAVDEPKHPVGKRTSEGSSRRVSTDTDTSRGRARSNSIVDLRDSARASVRFLGDSVIQHVEQISIIGLRARKTVEHAYFDVVFGSILMLNGLFIGAETNYLANSDDEVSPLSFRFMNLFFCT